MTAVPPRARRTLAALALLAPIALAAPSALAQRTAAAPSPAAFTLEQVHSYPFPNELVVAPTGARIAWVFNQEGRRNVWVAETPGWKARQLTRYDQDDGQELTNLSLTHDGGTVVYVRGGDHDANWNAEGNLPPDPLSSPVQPKVEIWAISVEGGAPKRLAQGDEPVLSPGGDRVAFTRDRQIWIVPTDGSAEPRRLFFARGESSSPEWSPDGSELAFVSRRGDHSFIGIFRNDSTPIHWMAPSTSRDQMPRWSPDGKQIVFARLPGSGGAPQTLLEQHPNPWAIWIADAASGSARPLWKSPVTLHGSYPRTDGSANLHWMANGRIVFLADLDGWPHLYSIPASGGEPLLLTPGAGMAEFIQASPDGRYLVYASNAGKGSGDIDRRHIFRVPVDRAAPVNLTPGEGVEWTPAITGDGRSIAFIGAGARMPPLPMVMPADGGKAQSIGAELIPADFPTAQLVVPRMVVFRAADGIEVHGQLFERPGQGKRPAVVFVHGGPPRQMLLGWHYMDYYSNGYAVNQYLANRGYVVLSVNYRLGIGYGHDFHHPGDSGPFGASEYRDVKAGGEYLRALPEVDPKRVGIWGGSYGGFLTALALGRNSDIFAAGVDLHGVHDFLTEGLGRLGGGAEDFEKPSDFDSAMALAWRSSPVSSVPTWTSPVLLIQGDDDRNVRFHQTVDLARRLAERGVPFEEMVIPDEIHGFLRHASWLAADSATAAYFDERFGVPPATRTAESR